MGTAGVRPVSEAATTGQFDYVFEFVDSPLKPKLSCRGLWSLLISWQLSLTTLLMQKPVCAQPPRPSLWNVIKFPELVRRSYDSITLNSQTHSFLPFLNLYYLLPINLSHSGVNGTITKARNFFESAIESPWAFTTSQTVWSLWLPVCVKVFNLEPISLSWVTLTKELALRLLIQYTHGNG